MACSAPVRLLVILNEENSMRLTLEDGIPESVEELIEIVQKKCSIMGYIRLQYKDVEFGNAYVNVTSTQVIRDLTVVKVIELNPESTATLYPVDVHCSPIPPSASPSVFTPLSPHAESEESSSGSGNSDDTIILHHSPSPLRTQQWPKVFHIPAFSYDTEMQLQKGNEAYVKNQTRLTPSTKMLSNILETLGDEIYKFKAYPSDADFGDVAKALIKKHPCLIQGGCSDEIEGWKSKLKVKMANYRSTLRAHGSSPEVSVNSLKRSPSTSQDRPAKNIKKPKRAEVNHFPPLPVGETAESMEEERVSILGEMKKRNNRQLVKMKMAKTFGYRRQEIVQSEPSTKEIKERWPALFQEEEVNAEFFRITTRPLESTMFAQLDRHASKLLEVSRKKGGSAGAMAAEIVRDFDEASMSATMDAGTRRQYILKLVMLFLGDPVDAVIKEHQIQQDLSVEEETMAVVVTPTDVKIVLEGEEVMTDLHSMVQGFAMLFGLIYALNMKYPKKCERTFEFVQKVLMGLDNKKMNTKVHRLSVLLHSE